MNKTYVLAALAGMLVLRWLATAQVTATVGGFPVVVPVLVLAVLALAALAAALVALAVWRMRAEQAMAAAWRAQRTVPR
jgi:hypothetical protein